MIRLLLAAFLAILPLSARDLHVGQPEFPTIADAIKAALPGDTIHLEPKVYRDYVGFYDKKGEPGRPITLDGHGATLEGSEAIDPSQWREVEPGLFAHDRLLPRLDEAIISRWFFLWDGKMNHMGRTSKGIHAPLKDPKDLHAGEWTFVRDPTRDQPPSKQIFGTFYLKIQPGKNLTEARIAAPVRSAGVQLNGHNAHLVIKNLIATHPYNDGFNIHGHCRDVQFENIQAIECGDDGISAHGTCEYKVNGFVSLGNSTGICDTVEAKTSYHGVFIAHCIGYDLFFMDNGRYRLSNALILSSAQTPFLVTGRDQQRCELDLDNVLLRRVGPPKPATITSTAIVRARRLTLENIEFHTTGTLEMSTDDPGADKTELMKLVPPNFQP